MRPFNSGDSIQSFKNHLNSVIEDINTLENGYVLNTAISELEAYYIEKATIKPLSFFPDQKQIASQSSTKINVRNDFKRAVSPGIKAIVSGTCIEITIPYEGDQELWKMRASSFSLGRYPEIEVKQNEIIFEISFADDSVDNDKLLKDVNSSIEMLVDGVKFINNDIEKYNQSVSEKIMQTLQKKQGTARAAVDAVNALGIPLKRSGSLPAYSLPLKRRERPAKKPTPGIDSYKPEPFIVEEEYQHILKVMNSMSLVIECNPLSFSSLNEETIRTHFLIQLNGHYDGGATGETFNASGKTDILIREGNKNVFIAECKFWHGPKEFKNAVDQLLGYLTWRDSKTALMIFNRNKDATAVRQKIHETMESLQEHKKTIHHNTTGDSRYILVKESEPGKEIIVTTQLYNIPENV